MAGPFNITRVSKYLERSFISKLWTREMQFYNLRNHMKEDQMRCGYDIRDSAQRSAHSTSTPVRNAE